MSREGVALARAVGVVALLIGAGELGWTTWVMVAAGFLPVLMFPLGREIGLPYFCRTLALSLVLGLAAAVILEAAGLPKWAVALAEVATILAAFAGGMVTPRLLGLRPGRLMLAAAGANALFWACVVVQLAWAPFTTHTAPWLTLTAIEAAVVASVVVHVWYSLRVRNSLEEARAALAQAGRIHELAKRARREARALVRQAEALNRAAPPPPPKADFGGRNLDL